MSFLKLLPIAFGVVGALLLAFAGLVLGAIFAQFFGYSILVVPLVLTIGTGLVLRSSKISVTAGEIIAIGGAIASVALVIILL